MPCLSINYLSSNLFLGIFISGSWNSVRISNLKTCLGPLNRFSWYADNVVSGSLTYSCTISLSLAVVTSLISALPSILWQMMNVFQMLSDGSGWSRNELAQSTVHSLFKMPNRLITERVYAANFWLTAFPHKDGIS